MEFMKSKLTDPGEKWDRILFKLGSCWCKARTGVYVETSWNVASQSYSSRPHKAFSLPFAFLIAEDD